jgi:hypothetical protein
MKFTAAVAEVNFAAGQALAQHVCRVMRRVKMTYLNVAFFVARRSVFKFLSNFL